jgi:hypothetical protein
MKVYTQEQNPTNVNMRDVMLHLLKLANYPSISRYIPTSYFTSRRLRG